MRKSITISILVPLLMIFSSCGKEEISLQTDSEFYEIIKGRWVPFKAISNEIITIDDFCAGNLFGVYMNAFEITEIEKYSPSLYCGTEFTESGFKGAYKYKISSNELTFTEFFENESPVSLTYILNNLTDSTMILKNAVTELHLKKID
ncbi:hypothetical protein [Haliscomenobacter sp.]|uniref:hypothetical protein n=1 Tax=Haliscomenobacter sp. TaxID=2717303 RepID=UPI003593770E